MKTHSKESLKKLGVVFFIATKDGWNHLASDMKKGLHYWTLDNSTFYGPFKSKREAERQRKKSLVTSQRKIPMKLKIIPSSGPFVIVATYRGAISKSRDIDLNRAFEYKGESGYSLRRNIREFSRSFRLARTGRKVLKYLKKIKGITIKIYSYR